MRNADRNTKGWLLGGTLVLLGAAVATSFAVLSPPTEGTIAIEPEAARAAQPPPRDETAEDPAGVPDLDVERVPAEADDQGAAQGQDPTPASEEISEELLALWDFEPGGEDGAFRAHLTVEDGNYPPEEFLPSLEGYFRWGNHPRPTTREEFIEFLIDVHMSKKVKNAGGYGRDKLLRNDNVYYVQRDVEQRLRSTLDDEQLARVEEVLQRHRPGLLAIARTVNGLAEELYLDKIARRDFVVFRKYEMPPPIRPAHVLARREYVTDKVEWYADITFDPFVSSAFTSSYEEQERMWNAMIDEAVQAAQAAGY